MGGSKLGTQAVSLLYQDEKTTKAAGLDWSLLDVDEYADDQKDADHKDHDHCCGHDHDGCGCGHDHDHDGCCCGHDHDADGHADAASQQG